MRKMRERRPGQGAASDTQVAIDNSNTKNIPDPGAAPQPSELPSFWVEADGFVTCTIIRRSDRAWWLTALAAGDETASVFWSSLRDWMARAPKHRPNYLACAATFSPRFLPTDWAMLTPLLGGPRTAMLSGICCCCSGRSDAELMDAVLRDLQTMNRMPAGSNSSAGTGSHDCNFRSTPFRRVPLKAKREQGRE
jgi:hypothetical protein